MQERTRFVAVTHGSFFLTGVVTTMLGPLLPELIRRWTLSDGQAGALFLAQSGGSLAGILASGRLIRRWGLLPGLTLGTLLMALGVLGVASPSLLVAAGGIGVYGVGLGIAIPTVNLLISDRSPGRRAAALNLLNLCWGVGAVVSPPLIAWCLLGGAAGWFLAVLAALLAVAALAQWREPRRHPGGLPAHGAAGGSRFRQMPRLLLALLLFFYVATEIGTAGWIPTYSLRLGMGEWLGSWLVAGFWASLLAGRALSPLLLRRLDPPSLVLGALLAALAGEVIFLSSADTAPILLGVALTGLGLAVIYPTTVATFSEFYGEQASARAVPVFAMASLGGALGPWIIGLVSEQTANLRLAMGLLIAGVVVMIALQGLIVRLWRSEGPSTVVRGTGIPAGDS